ncbi:MAG TPA: glycosyltransferase [Anaerolineales bacterium]|nr:glycosyltransferase [Anaerolineae bacterium]HIQ01953.1 glycosyltransferase [Anaerolineales bacterium]
MEKSNPTLDLSVVMPVYNEAGSLPALHAELTAVLGRLGRSYEILAVDDGSSDESLSVLRRLQAGDPHLRIVRFRRNFGQTAAFAAGFDHARGRVVVTIDADGQNDPADIPRLLKLMEEGDYDIVSGWRQNRKEPFLTRRLPSMVANRLISQTTGVRLHDYGCSLKAYRAEVVRNVHLYGELHRFIPALAGRMGVRVAEVGVNDRPRTYGRSKYGISRTIRVLLDLFTVTYLLSFSSRPMQLFGLIGLGLGGAGGAIGLYLAGAKIAHGLLGGAEGFRSYRIGTSPWLMLAVLLIVLGVQFIVLGLLAEVITRTYHEAQNKPIYAIREVIEPEEEV